MLVALALAGCSPFGGPESGPPAPPLEEEAPRQALPDAAPDVAIDAPPPTRAGGVSDGLASAARARPPLPSAAPTPYPSELATSSRAPEGRRADVVGPPAAPLRAGMTDDNDAFGAYLEFLATWGDRAATRGRHAPTDVRGRSLVRVVDAGGDPVPDAEITVSGRAGAAWSAETRGDGSTWFFPALALPGDTAEGVTVTAGGVTGTVAWSGDQDLVVRLDRDLPGTARVPLDVLLVVDTTGSMGDEIERIKATLRAVTREVHQLERPVDLRYGAVLYRDRNDVYDTRVIPFTADTSAFDREIAGLSAGGGGDTPEDLNAGLDAAVHRVSWRDTAAKVAFLVADAPPHMDYQGPDYRDAALAAAASGIRVHTVAASGLDPVGTLVFRQVAQLTAGKFVYIEYGSAGASAERHGVAAPTGSNNLDAILLSRLREEVEGWGRGSERVAAR